MRSVRANWLIMPHGPGSVGRGPSPWPRPESTRRAVSKRSERRGRDRENSARSPPPPPVQQLDPPRRHAGIIGEALDDRADRDEMQVGVRRQRDGAADDFAGRSESVRNEHLDGLLYSTRLVASVERGRNSIAMGPR